MICLVSDQAAVIAVLKDIETYGLSAVGCQFRQIEGKLWEIKIKAPNGGYRIFYVMISSVEMMCLHAYKNKGKRLPKKNWKLLVNDSKRCCHEKENSKQIFGSIGIKV